MLLARYKQLKGKISLLNICVLKIIVQTNLNNKYLSRPNNYLDGLNRYKSDECTSFCA